jgi:hypothetical protein
MVFIVAPNLTPALTGVKFIAPRVANSSTKICSKPLLVLAKQLYIYFPILPIISKQHNKGKIFNSH